MGLTLDNIPGFADQSDTILAAGELAQGQKLGRISENAAFGMARTEIFVATYKNGDTVTIPQSAIDGYAYTRGELLYLWAPASTGNPDSNFASYGPPWTLWYLAYKVDQTTGAVSCATGYRGNQDHAERQASTNDGQLVVFTIAQRQRTTLTLAAEPSYTDFPDADFYQDAPLTEAIAQGLNQSAKFSIVNSEVIYMGEFADGETVSTPVSPADGYSYSYAECNFMTALRWTMDDDGGTPPTAQVPDIAKGQLADWSTSVNASTGEVSISIIYESSGHTTYNTGRVAVFAICQRDIGTTFSLGDDFAEIDPATFFPGETLRASTMAELANNVRRAAVTPEIFAPASYSNGDTIPAPTSAIDGYTYTRDELQYVWDWDSTQPDPSGHSGYRMNLASASVLSSGLVQIVNFRFYSGGDSVVTDNDGSIKVIVIGVRQYVHTVPAAPVTNPQSGTVTDDGYTPVVSSGSGAPDSSPEVSGLDGDFYFDTDTGLLYHRESGAWVSTDLSLVGKGAITAGTAITVTDAGDGTTEIAANEMVGDSGSGGTAGIVPAPAAGDATDGKFLKADGTWAVPEGSGGDSSPSSGGGSSFAWGGDGSDGAVIADGASTVTGLGAPSGGVYAMTRDCFFTTLVVNSGVTVQTANYVIYASVSVTVSGSITNDGTNGTAGTNGLSTGTGPAATASGSKDATNGAAGSLVLPNAASLGNPPLRGAGGAGNTGAGSQAATATGGSNASPALLAQYAPSTWSSGAGGAGASGAGGAARANGTNGSSIVNSPTSPRSPEMALHMVYFDATAVKRWQVINQVGAAGGGGGGGGDGTNKGGGGGSGGGNGGSGGFLVISSPTITVNSGGIISASGGDGGVGGNGGTPASGNCGGGGGAAGGAGGSGGVIALIYQSLTNSGSITVAAGSGGSGGTHGNGVGTGSNGSDGQAGPSGTTGLIIEIAQ